MTVPDADLDRILAAWPVTDDHLVLLETVWDSKGGVDGYWPTWDYVRRTLA